MFLNSKISQIAHKVSGAKFERLATPTIRLTYGGKSWGFSASAANYWREQWWHGLKQSGVLGTYAQSTIKRKKQKGLPWDRVTLYDTGRLYNSLEVYIEGRDVYIQTNVDYFQYLENRYGQDIIYLHETKHTEFINDIRKATIDYFKMIIHGNG